MINIGSLSVDDCYAYGLTGVLARSSGLKRDLRLSLFSSYSGYNSLTFRSFIGVNGDTYDRYLIRMLEMGESLSIINTMVLKLLQTYVPQGVSKAMLSILPDSLISKGKKSTNSYSSMEDLITHFINSHSGYCVPSQLANVYIESPKGEFGVGLVSNNTEVPAKCKIRSPSYYNLQFLGKLTKGHYLSDLAALIGTIDIVFGEIDR